MAHFDVDPFANATKQLHDACDILGIKDKGVREYLAIMIKDQRKQNKQYQFPLT